MIRELKCYCFLFGLKDLLIFLKIVKKKKKRIGKKFLGLFCDVMFLININLVFLILLNKFIIE